MSDFVNIVESALSTITLWHGGRNVDSDYLEVLGHRSGRWEHGPGLYLTTHFDTAMKYAKGSNKLYRVTIRSGTDIDDVTIPIEDAIAFVERRCVGSSRKKMIEDLKENLTRAGVLRAEVLVNLCLNNEALQASKTVYLRQFLIDHGVDYSKTRYGGRDETVVVVINPRIIKSVEHVKPSTVDTEDYVRSAVFP